MGIAAVESRYVLWENRFRLLVILGTSESAVGVYEGLSHVFLYKTHRYYDIGAFLPTGSPRRVLSSLCSS